MWHSHLNDMEIPETKRFIPKGFELGTTLSWGLLVEIDINVRVIAVSMFCLAIFCCFVFYKSRSVTTAHFNVLSFVLLRFLLPRGLTTCQTWSF